MNSLVTTAPLHGVISLGGFPIASLTAQEAENCIETALDTNTQLALFFANTNFVVKCQPLKETIAKSPTLIINDGIGLDIAAWLVHRKKFQENLPGTDFLPFMLNNTNTKAKVFLFGAKPGIATRAANTLRTENGVTVVGIADGYEQARDVEKLIETINASQANILLVAMGNPFQEQWILQHRHRLNTNVLIGVGALFDFLAGDKPRAPELVRKLRLEWLYRLSLEPTRLMRRYTVDIAVFLAICFRAEKASSAKQ